MADVRGLVGIDVGVLDDHLFVGRRRLHALAAQQVRRISAAVEPDVDVPVARHFQGGDAGDRADLRRQFRGDLLRRLAQLFRQLECRGHRHLTEIALPRLFDVDRQVDAVANLYMRVEGARNLFFYGMKHGNYEYNVAAFRSRIPAPWWCGRN